MPFGRIIRKIRASRQQEFSSASYWENRYANSGNSGDGSYGELAEFKARTINRIITDKNIRSIIEFGCGDGNNLALYQLNEYTGVDVSKTAVEMCARKFKGRPYQFKTLGEYVAGPRHHHDMALSIDVIFHLVENDIYQEYMERLFDAASRHVLIYSSCVNYHQTRHVRHRNFMHWVAGHRPQWTLEAVLPNEFPAPDLLADVPGTSFADFYLYARHQPLAGAETPKT